MRLITEPKHDFDNVLLVEEKAVEVKTCSKCKDEKYAYEFGVWFSKRNNKEYVRSRCKKCEVISASEYNKIHKDKRQKYERNYRLVKKFGVTYDEKIIMLEEQDYKCAICFELVNESSYLDHNHETEKLRQILCRNCNLLLGHCKDSIVILENAIKYLRIHNESN